MGNENEKRNEFSDETVEKAWEDAEKKCEKCGKELKWKNRGRDKDDYWEAHHKDSNPKNDKLENCQILCWPCHEKTFKKSAIEQIEEILRKNKPTKLMLKKKIQIKK